MNDMRESFLAIRLGGQQVALRALQVQTLILLGAIVPVPHAPAHILGLTSVRSRVLTVVDPARLLRSESANAVTRDKDRHAVIMEVAGHGYAVVVEAVLNVTDALGALDPVPDDLGPEWAEMAEGIIETDLGPLLVLKGDELVSGKRQNKAA